MARNWTQNQAFCYFFMFTPLVFLEIPQDDSLEHCLDKTLEKNLGPPKLGLKLGQGFWHFLKVPSLVFPDIAQDCSLGQCLTASRAVIFSILMLLSVHSKLLVYIVFCNFIKCPNLIDKLCILQQHQSKYNQRDVYFLYIVLCICLFPISSLGKVLQWLFQTGFFSFSHIRQVFIFYSNNCMGICFGRPSIGCLR